jgi:hypothetical protein
MFGELSIILYIYYVIKNESYEKSEKQNPI